MSGSQSTKTESAKTDPYAPAQANLTNQLDRARDLSANTSNFMPTYSDATQQSVQGLIGAAGRGSAAVDPLTQLRNQSMTGYGIGQGTLQNAAGGGMMGQNSALRDVMRQSNQDVADQVASSLSGRGRFGDNAATVAEMTKRLAQANNQAYAGQYNTDMSNRLNAANTLNQGGQVGAQAAGQLDQANLYGTNLMGQAGAIQDQQAAAKRQAPLQALQYQAGITNPIAGLGQSTSGTSTTSTPANTGGMIAGAAMAGLGVATGNPMMAMNGVGSFAGSASGGQGGGGNNNINYGSGNRGGGGGQPFFGAFGSSSTDPGTAANGGWSTTTNKPGWAGSGWGNLG